MKSYLDLISILLLFFSAGQLNAQCPTTLTFCSQDSVNAFPKTYPGCHNINTLIFDKQKCLNELNNIVNLDSLYPLTSIQNLRLNPSSLIRDFSGLSNVHKINHASIYAHKSWPTPLPLDTVHTLDFYFPNDTIMDISLLSKLKFVSHRINFLRNGNFTPSLEYRTNDSFYIYIQGNVIKNKIQNILPNNLSASRISFDLISSENIDFDFGYTVDSICSLKMFHSPNNDFSTWRDVKKIGLLEMVNSNNESLHQFKCEEIEHLAIGVCSSLTSLRDLFPNLKRITHAIGLWANKNLEFIDLLDNCELPSVNAVPGELYQFGGILTNESIYYIIIEANPKLNSCKSNYVCRALKRFGDTIYIGGNLTDCNDILLNKTCSSSSTSEDINENPWFFSPNPVVDILNISPPMQKGTGYRVINLLGNTVQSGEMYDSISLGELPSGHYIIMLDNPDKHQAPQVIKIVKI